MAVFDPNAFIHDGSAKTAIIKGLAETVGVQPENIALNLSIATRIATQAQNNLIVKEQNSQANNIVVDYTITTLSIDQAVAPPSSIVSALQSGDIANKLKTNVEKNLPAESNYHIEIIDVPIPIAEIQIITHTKTTYTKTTTTTDTGTTNTMKIFLEMFKMPLTFLFKPSVEEEVKILQGVENLVNRRINDPGVGVRAEFGRGSTRLSLLKKHPHSYDLVVQVALKIPADKGNAVNTAIQLAAGDGFTGLINELNGLGVSGLVGVCSCASK